MEDVWIIPKNIRQIGESHGQISIFIEDYAATFISQFVKSMGTGVRQAVCIGRIYEETERTSIIIEGVVVDAGEYQTSDPLFAPDDCIKMRRDCNTYFPEKETIGRLIMDTEAQKMPEAVFLKQIEDGNQTYPAGIKFVMHAGKEEGITAFYVFSHGAVQRLDNYYIFYDKNEEMQNYLITWHEKLRGPAEEPAPVQREETAEKELPVKRIPQRHGTSLPVAECAACLLLIGACVTGIINLNNYQKMQGFETTLNQLTLDFYGEGDSVAVMDPHEETITNAGEDLPLYIPGEGAADTSTNSGQDGTADAAGEPSQDGDADAAAEFSQDGTADAAAEPSQDETAYDGTGSGQDGAADAGADHGQEESGDADTAQNNGEGTNNGDTAYSSSGENNAVAQNGDTATGAEGNVNQNNDGAGGSVVTQTVSYQEYIVKQGDTLSSICYAFYQDRSRVAEVCQLNGITDPDRLAVGQKILLP